MGIDKAEVIKKCYPITQLKMYPNGCVETIRKSRLKGGRDAPQRGKISKMSKKSLIRLMFLMHCTQVVFRSMLTLTYGKYYPGNGTIVKKDLNQLCKKLKKLDVDYLWFLEFQARGAPHVHVLTTMGEMSPRLRADFGLFWVERIAKSDWFIDTCPEEDYSKEVLKLAKFNLHETVWELIRKPDGARNYVVKYASKAKQKRVPARFADVGRFWGCSDPVRPEAVLVDTTELEVSLWLDELGHPAGDYDVTPKYIWPIGNLEQGANE